MHRWWKKAVNPTMNNRPMGPLDLSEVENQMIDFLEFTAAT